MLFAQQQNGFKVDINSVRCLVKKPELSKLFKLKDIEGREAAVMPSRPEVSPRALEEHGQERCRSYCSSVKLC